MREPACRKTAGFFCWAISRPRHELVRRALERDEIRLGRDDGPFFFSCPERNAARVPRAGAHFTLHGVVFAILCPGPAVHRPLRVEDARERAYEAPRHVRDTRSLALRAYGESIQLQPITL